MAKFESLIHSIRGLIKEKDWNSEQNWLKLHISEGQGPKWKTTKVKDQVIVDSGQSLNKF